MYRFFVQADSAITTDIKKVIAILETLDFKVEMIGALIKLYFLGSTI